MNVERRMALVPGLLFIIATVAALVGDAVLGPILEGPAYLATISAHQARVALALAFKLLGAGASAGVAISLYPILRMHSEGLALGAVCFRTIESVFYIINALGLLCLVSLGRDYLSAGAALGPQLQSLGSSIQAGRRWAGFVLAVIAFCPGAGMYYYVFFRTRLVPRWLSVWGMLALAMLLAMAVMEMFGAEPAGLTLVLALPIAVQEMVLAIWLLVKGFNAAAPKSPESLPQVAS